MRKRRNLTHFSSAPDATQGKIGVDARSRQVLDSVLRALIKEGWTITDRKVRLPFDTSNSYVDFLAERTLIAERGAEKIAVEVKTFAGKSV